MTDLGRCGEFQLLELVSTGGTAEVYLAAPLDAAYPRRLVAIKWALPYVSNNESLAMSMLDEARILGSLEHRNIGRVLGHGEHDGRLFVVMDYIHGKALHDVQDRIEAQSADRPFATYAFIVSQIAAALDYAHHRCDAQGEPMGIVHRDINPLNIMVRYDGIPQVIDFGIAKAAQRAVQTQTGIVKGKSAYMAPEQARGRRIDARCDIFALGIVLYELATGTQPFEGDDPMQRLQAAADCRFVPAHEVNPKLPRTLARIVEKAMRKNPARRHQRAVELYEALLAFIAEQGEVMNENNVASYMDYLFHAEREAAERHLRHLWRQTRSGA